MKLLFQSALLVVLLFIGFSLGAKSAEYWENKWDFAPLPFGGQFIDVYLHNTTTKDLPPTYPEDVEREFGVHAYCLVKEGDPSQFRYSASDSVWHWYFGNTIRVYVIEAQTGVLKTYDMGMTSGTFVVAIKAGDYMAGTILRSKPGRYALVGVSDIPAILMSDIHVPSRLSLITKYPEHTDVITDLTSDVPPDAIAEPLAEP